MFACISTGGRKSEKPKMGSRKIILFFSIFTCLNLVQSSYALHVRTLLPDHNLRVTKMLKHSNYGIDVDGAGNERTHIALSNKITAGGGGRGGGSRGGSGGSSNGGAENGNGGNSGRGAGGAAVIPVVVAGAANNNRHPNNHHGVATKNCITLPILIMINMASLIYLYALEC